MNRRYTTAIALALAATIVAPAQGVDLIALCKEVYAAEMAYATTMEAALTRCAGGKDRAACGWGWPCSPDSAPTRSRTSLLNALRAKPGCADEGRSRQRREGARAPGQSAWPHGHCQDRRPRRLGRRRQTSIPFGLFRTRRLGGSYAHHHRGSIRHQRPRPGPCPGQHRPQADASRGRVLTFDHRRDTAGACCGHSGCDHPATVTDAGANVCASHWLDTHQA